MLDNERENFQGSMNFCGARVRLIRQQQRLTIATLSEMLEQRHNVILSTTDIEWIEQGMRQVSDIELAAFATVLSVPLTQLVWGETPPPDENKSYIRAMLTHIHCERKHPKTASASELS